MYRKFFLQSFQKNKQIINHEDNNINEKMLYLFTLGVNILRINTKFIAVYIIIYFEKPIT